MNDPLTAEQPLDLEPGYLDRLRNGRWKTWELPMVADELERMCKLAKDWEELANDYYQRIEDARRALLGKADE